MAVTSGAIAAGLPVVPTQAPLPAPAMSSPCRRWLPSGQSRLMRVYDRSFAGHGLVCGQVLLVPLDFGLRQQYLHARDTIRRMLELGVVPVVNENDTIADDSIRFGDNDRLAALVAHLVDADLLVLLTDTPGLLTADPRLDPSASLIEEIVEVDQCAGAGRRPAGRPGERRHGVQGGGGQDGGLVGGPDGDRGRRPRWRAVRHGGGRAGCRHDRARPRPPAAGPQAVDRVRRARQRRDRGRRRGPAGAGRAWAGRCSPAGVVEVDGRFDADAAVEIADTDGLVFAKGLVRVGSAALAAAAGRRTADLPDGMPHEVVHRDDLVVLPT